MVALTFTEHMTSEHPLFDKPSLVTDAVNELLEAIGKRYGYNDFPAAPAIIYYGERAWQRSKFAPEAKTA